MRFLNNLLVLLFLLFGLSSLFSQEKGGFKSSLNSLEEFYNVKFSYVNSAIEDISLDKNLDTFESLQEVLDYLNTYTYLKVVRIDDRYISISVKENTYEVCGYLIDFEGKPISNVNIIVLGKSYGTITNSEGYFAIKNLEISDYIEINHIGFTSIIKNVNQFYNSSGVCETLLLSENNVELQEVVVRNYITKSLSKLNDGTIRLDTKAFDILAGQVDPDLLQTSQAFPGIETPDESVANINVRNGTSDQNAVYWDDIKMYHASHFFGLISAINPFLTNSISIVKNGTSSKYNDGVSSAIFLETDNMINDSIQGGVGVNMIATDGYIIAPLNNKLELNASYRRSINDFINTPTYNAYFDKTFQNNTIGNNANNTSFNFYDVNLSALYKLSEKHQFKANFIKIDNKLTHKEIDTSNLKDAISQGSTAYGMTYSYLSGKKIALDISGYHSNYELLSDNYQNNQEQLVKQRNDVTENTLKATANYYLNSYNKITLGYQLNETGILNALNVNNPIFNRIQKGVIINHAAFVENEYIKEQWYVRSGIRFNYFDKLKEYTIEPRFNVKYNLNNHLSFSGKFEWKSQYTAQVIDFLDDFLGVESRRWVLSSSDIPLIKSRQASLGLTYKKRKLILDLALFHKTVNGILISSLGFQNQIQDRRISGDQASYGLEILLNKRFKKTNLWTTYTWSKSELLFPEINTNYFTDTNDIRHSSIFGINHYFTDNLNISLTYNLKSGRPYSIPVDGQETSQNGSIVTVNYDTLNAERLAPYQRLDFSASYTILNKQRINLKLKAGILNILNSQQTLQRYYVVDENDTTKAREINIQSLRITPNVSLRVNFN